MKPATLAKMTEAQSDAAFSRQASAIRMRRAGNPVREARRQHELTRMHTRLDFVPTYKDIYDRNGTIISATYRGHVAVRAQ